MAFLTTLQEQNALELSKLNPHPPTSIKINRIQSNSFLWQFIAALEMLVRVGVAALLAAFLGLRGIKKRSLDASGAAAAFVVGFLTLAVGYHYGTIVTTPT